MIRILFVEDEHAFAIGVIDRLNADGYDVRWESNGSAGYQIARANTFDLILLDISLPGKNGFDICRDQRREGVSAPVLMLTARGEVTDRVLGLKLGADDHVQKKPANLSSLWRASKRRLVDHNRPCLLQRLRVSVTSVSIFVGMKFYAQVPPLFLHS